MTLIIKQNELEAFCQRQKNASFITVDTEFLREKTYYSKLCLIQVASEDEAVAIDPLAEDIDLKPFLDLLYDESILKIFHASWQDIEIFVNLTKKVPLPLFDTQLAAMVCGFGDQIGYDRLVQQITKVEIDKSMRRTDWSRRPLTNKQLEYALSDVTHLRDVYKYLSNKLSENNRILWLDEEMEKLTSAENYITLPEDAWQKIKLRKCKPHMMPVIEGLAAWRESEAIRRDMPRRRVLKDEQIIEISSSKPQDANKLARVRGLSDGYAHGKKGAEIIKVVKNSIGKKSNIEKSPKRPRKTAESEAVMDLLRVLLKQKSAAFGVASRLIANSADLESLSLDDNADISAQKGWRYEVFGADAIALKQGKLALFMQDGKLSIAPFHKEKSEKTNEEVG